MNRIGAFFKSFTGRRPPTGPLTTAEANDAEELRLDMLAKDNRPKESEQTSSDTEASADSE